LNDTLSVAPKEHTLAFLRNVALGARRLRRSPGFALTAVLTLTLGTGATAAVFTLVNAVVLRPLPWQSPENVGLIWAVQPSGERTWLSFPELERLQQEPGGLSGVSGITDLRPHYEHDGVGQELQALAVSHGFFGMLGVPPALGRDFVGEDDRAGAAPVVILSDAFWRVQLGGDAAALGRPLTLNGRDYSVIGILPASFELLPASTVLPDHVDLWLPLEPHLASRDRSVRFLHVLARLRPNVTFARADNQLRSYGAQLSREFPTSYPGGTWTLRIVSFRDDVLKNARVALSLLFGLVVLVLLMACSNVANLLLAQGEARRTELAIRSALGAGTARLAGELLGESFLLAVCGSGLGLAWAACLPPVLRAIDPGALPRLRDAGVDLRVMVFVLGLMLLTVVTFASVPLIERLRLRNLSALMAGRSGGRTPRSAKLARVLVAAQTALATTILVTTLFLTDTFVHLQGIDLGFSPRNVLSGRVSLSPKYPAGPTAVRFFESATAAIQAVPGVVSAAAVTQLPLSGSMLGSSFLVTPEPEPRRIDADLRGITPDYFHVIGTPLLRGRFFSDRDSADGQGVVIVDEAFARRLSPDGQVIGKRVRWFRQPDAELEIVGVVASIRHRGPDQGARETVYRPHRQYPRNSMFLVVRTNQDAAASAGAVRHALATVDPSQPFAEVFTMDQRLGRAVTRARTSLLLAAALTVLALALGGVGLYGVLSVGVAQRMREFGVRMTLGATPRAVRHLVLREGLALTALGAALGAAGAAVIVTLVRSALYDARVVNVPLYAGGVVLVFLFSLIALWIPARRAGGADPIASLRAD
jgi:putative ABC transport system permease protein